MKINSPLKAVVIITMLFSLAIPRGWASAAGSEILPSFTDFVSSVTDGQAQMVRGVYVPGILAFRVMQQPAGDTGTVLPIKGIVTQFRSAALYNVIGLLAHNNLAGASFSDLRIGQDIRIVYGDGRVEYFMVNRLSRFQALQPSSRYGNFMDLSTYNYYTTQDIFSMFYEGNVHVTFQTCILQGGDSSWGRLFVTAIPIPPLHIREIRSLLPMELQDYNKMMNVPEMFFGDSIFR